MTSSLGRDPVIFLKSTCCIDTIVLSTFPFCVLKPFVCVVMAAALECMCPVVRTFLLDCSVSAHFCV